jgi:superfamily II DNA/RNA helicase
LHNLLSKHLCPSYESVTVAGGKDVASSHSSPDGREALSSKLSKRRKHVKQIVFVSAVIPQRSRFVKTCQQRHWIEVEPHVIHMKNAMNGFIRTPIQIQHHVLYCESQEKKLGLLRRYIRHLVLKLNLNDEFDRGIIFVNEDRPLLDMVKILNHDLNKMFLNKFDINLATTSTHGNNNNNNVSGSVTEFVGLLDDHTSKFNLNERALAMSNFRSGLHKFVVATEVAARGIDIPEVSHIILFDLPKTEDDYLHRGGRTGRMGRNGTVVSLASKGDKFIVVKYSNSLNIPITDITDSI